MKVRIKGNSLRLRLLRGEVSRFGETGRVSETIQFSLSPREANSEAKTIGARFADNQITVTIPEATARNWVDSDLITLESNQPNENGSQNGAGENVASQYGLKILIEKDFVCLDRKDDPDNIDAFPHPTGKCS